MINAITNVEENEFCIYGAGNIGLLIILNLCSVIIYNPFLAMKLNGEVDKLAKLNHYFSHCAIEIRHEMTNMMDKIVKICTHQSIDFDPTDYISFASSDYLRNIDSVMIYAPYEEYKKFARINYNSEAMFKLSVTHPDFPSQDQLLLARELTKIDSGMAETITRHEKKIDPNLQNAHASDPADYIRSLMASDILYLYNYELHITMRSISEECRNKVKCALT